MHRGEYKDTEKSLHSTCVGQVLIPVVSLEPLKKPSSERYQPKSDLRLEPLEVAIEVHPGEQLTKLYEKEAAKAAAVAGAVATRRRRGSLDSAGPLESVSDFITTPGLVEQPRSILGRKSTRFGGGSKTGSSVGGVAKSEVEEWRHVMGKSEYKREKKQTKERRTRKQATDANDDLFRNLAGGGMGGGGGNRADDMMSVKSAPGAFGSGRRPNPLGSKMIGSDKDFDSASMASMPISGPSSIASSGSQGKRRGGRSIRFESDSAMSEASGISEASASGTGSGTGSAQSAESDNMAVSDEEPAANSDEEGGAATPRRRVHPDPADEEPEAEGWPAAGGAGGSAGVEGNAGGEPAAEGAGCWSWYEIFPFHKVNSDGVYRPVRRWHAPSLPRPSHLGCRC